MDAVWILRCAPILISRFIVGVAAHAVPAFGVVMRAPFPLVAGWAGNRRLLDGAANELVVIFAASPAGWAGGRDNRRALQNCRLCTEFCGETSRTFRRRFGTGGFTFFKISRAGTGAFAIFDFVRIRADCRPGRNMKFGPLHFKSQLGLACAFGVLVCAGVGDDGVGARMVQYDSKRFATSRLNGCVSDMCVIANKAKSGILYAHVCPSFTRRASCDFELDRLTKSRVGRDDRYAGDIASRLRSTTHGD